MTETIIITAVVNRIIVIIDRGIITEGNSVFVVTAFTNESLQTGHPHLLKTHQAIRYFILIAWCVL